MFVIFDLDGTLANDTERRQIITQLTESGSRAYQGYKPYHELCSQDPPNEPLIRVLKDLLVCGHQIEIWTGRPDTYKRETQAWIFEHIGPELARHIRLRMRPENDTRSSNDVKGAWLCEYDNLPDLVFDDRSKCVDFWRSQGILTCQVADNT